MLRFEVIELKKKDISKIVIIDDESDILYTIKEICMHGGWEVATASNGKQGYELCKIHKPNLAIVDYHMPDWDGLTTVKRIRQLDNDLSILVLTVDERQEIADKFITAGATDFAIKPFKSLACNTTSPVLVLKLVTPPATPPVVFQLTPSHTY